MCGATITLPTPTIVNNEGEVTITTSIGDGPGTSFLFPVGATQVIYTAFDAVADTTVQDTITVTVNDTELPTITCVNDITTSVLPGQNNALIVYNLPEFSDNCPGAAIEQLEGLSSGSVFPAGTTTNTFQVTDSSGNVNTCSFSVIITVQDTLRIDPMADITNPNDFGKCGATVNLPTPNIINAVGEITIATFVSNDVSTNFFFPVGVTTVIFEASDAATSQTARDTLIVTIEDREKPTIICPSNIVVDVLPGETSAVINFDNPIFSDNCPGVVLEQIEGLASGSAFPLGNTDISFHAVDAATNADTCTFTITVIEQDLLQIVGLSDITQSNDQGECGAAITLPEATIVNNVGEVTITVIPLSASVINLSETSLFFPVGSTEVIYQASDAGTGQIDRDTLTVTINDAEPPSISCPANITLSVPFGEPGAVVNF